jgi:tetratricopeptide (TPR) repeat protein
MLIGSGLMLYNFLRFDNPFEFGWHYQLQGGYRPDTARQFSLHYLWFNFRFYFLEPMRWSGHFPFLQTVLPPPLPSGYFGVGKPYYGGIILVNYPLAWLALAAPLAWKGRPIEAASFLTGFVAVAFLLFVTCALTLCLFFSAGSRYELDFLPALMLLAVIGILGLERVLPGSPSWRRIARSGWCLLLAYSVVLNLLATVEAHAEANYFAGNFLVRQGRANEALEHFHAALALEPGSAAFHAGLGTAYYRIGRLDEAIIQFQKALEIEPDFADAAEAHNNLGYSLLQKGQVNEAIAHFQRALEINPDFAETHNTLGDCLLQIGRLDEAIIQYQKALEIKPDFAEAQNNFGYVLFQMGRVSDAITHFQKALEINPDFIEAHCNLGSALVQIGRLDEAIVHYQKVIELQPHFLQAYNDLGDTFRRKGMANEAIAYYQKAIELQPQSMPAQIDLAWMLATWPESSVRNGVKAVVLAEQANRLSDGKDPLILRVLAAAYAEVGRFPEAALTAKKALALAEAQSNTRLINELQMEIGLYQVNSPYRSTNN